MLAALLIATVTGLATGLGVVPFFFTDHMPRRLYDAILGMGAGLMISASTLGLLGGALERVRANGKLDVGALLQVIFGFVCGVIVLASLERIPHQHAGGHHEHLEHTSTSQIHPHEAEHDERVQHRLLISAMTLHRLPEGFAIGAGFAAGDGALEHLGWVLAVAVAFQNICEGAVMGAPLRHSGWSRARTLLTVASTGLAVPIAACAGYLTGQHLVKFLPFALALASGGLIYLISNEIIPESHSHGNEREATVGIVCGFLVTIVVFSLGHS